MSTARTIAFSFFIPRGEEFLQISRGCTPCCPDNPMQDPFSVSINHIVVSALVYTSQLYAPSTRILGSSGQGNLVDPNPDSASIYSSFSLALPQQGSHEVENTDLYAVYGVLHTPSVSTQYLRFCWCISGAVPVGRARRRPIPR